MTFLATYRIRIVAVGSGLALAAGLVGCDTSKLTNPEYSHPQGPTTSIEYPAGMDIPDIPVSGRAEVDLVEEMILHRTLYARMLNVLARYYSEQGYPEKAAWAQTELNGLRRVKTYRYILDAEVPRAELRPMESIAEADRLYEEGRALMKRGGHGIAIFYNQDTMRLALTKFKELIERYPTSDKIDDAAYYIGEIHKEYEKEQDNTLAIEWYKRAIEWDPNTPHPCRFRIATTYDYRLHERENALYWYQKVLEEESRFTSADDPDFTLNTRYAQNRIQELTPEEHLRSPGEVVTGDRRTPTGSSEPIPGTFIEEPAP